MGNLSSAGADANDTNQVDEACQQESEALQAARVDPNNIETLQKLTSAMEQLADVLTGKVRY
jgi:hypothetical protein